MSRLHHPTLAFACLTVATTFALVAPAQAAASAAPAPAAAAPAAAPAGPFLDIAGLSKTVAACDDFFLYVNGNWLAGATIPPQRARVGSFVDVREYNRAVVQQALTAGLQSPALLDTDGKRLAATYYASGMDTAAIDRRGLAPLAPLLGPIAALDSPAQLAALMARLDRARIGTPLGVFVAPDAADKRIYRVQLYAGGLGLPDRDDYLKDDARARGLRTAYVDYVTRLLVLAGTPAAEAGPLAAQVLALETTFARAALTRVQARDPRAVYNLRTPAELAAQVPAIDWTAFLRELGVPAVAALNVAQPAYVQAVATATTTTPLPVWRAYLKVLVLNAAAEFLPQPYVDAAFAFQRRAVQGEQEPQTRADRVVDAISGRTGGEPVAEGIGQLYVARAFSPAAKARALVMVDDIKAALRDRIRASAWMSPPAQARAIAKIDAMAVKIGYPDQWKRYDGLVLAPDDFAGNWLRAGEWDFARRLGDLDKPVDRTRWNPSPHIVNAFAGGLNDIVFPAGILQRPFFDPQADDAVNYGGIGSVIGHEITHHFDDRGRQFDEFGNLADWWTAADVAAYRARADQLAAQFSRYEPLPGQFLNGRQTLGETISDLGGALAAFDALQRAQQRQPTAPIDGLTPQQRFFVSFGTIWRGKERDEFVANQLRAGQHPPGRFRVKGTLVNVPAFAETFGCKPGARMSNTPEQRVVIW